MGSEINSLFFNSDRNALDGLNDNGVPIRSLLLNIATGSGDDSQHIQNNRTALFPTLGLDAQPDRSTDFLVGLNTFRGTPGAPFPDFDQRRRVVVMNGNTREVLFNMNEATGAFSASEIQAMITAINSVSAEAADPVAEWAEGNAIPEGQRGDIDDPDGDGVDNLVEYALDTDPNRGEFSRDPRIVEQDGMLFLDFQARQDLEGFSLSVLSTTDLTLPFTPLLTNLAPSSGTAISGRLPYLAPLGNGDTRRFFRLAVTRDTED